MTKVKDIIQYLERFASFSLQESYDNAGLLTGDINNEITGILISLDCTEEVVNEAIAKNINTIISHHPIVFSGLKSLTGKNYVERTIIKAIKHDINLIAVHTNLDNVLHGVNGHIADKLQLINRKILAPKNNLLRLITFVPSSHSTQVTHALGNAGAGQIGNYKNCSFQSEGIGSFEPNEKANPTIGKAGSAEQVHEKKIEVIFPDYLKEIILKALFQTHPYEEVAYYLQPTLNPNQEEGSGIIGELTEEINAMEFLSILKKEFNLKVIKHTALIHDKIKSVAICGGSGSFLLPKAKVHKADIFITADFKYHEYFDHENQTIIADIGHYESEVYTKDLLCRNIKENFTNIAVDLSEINTNPIHYFI